jgi:hypothetical protein
MWMMQWRTWFLAWSLRMNLLVLFGWVIGISIGKHCKVTGDSDLQHFFQLPSWHWSPSAANLTNIHSSSTDCRRQI